MERPERQDRAGLPAARVDRQQQYTGNPNPDCRQRLPPGKVGNLSLGSISGIYSRDPFLTLRDLRALCVKNSFYRLEVYVSTRTLLQAIQSDRALRDLQ